METKIAQQTANVVIVEATEYTRQVLRDCLVEMGFVQLAILANHDQLLEHLGKHSVDWICAPITSNCDTNLMHILKTISEVPSLKGIRVSAFWEESQLHCLTTAFELGLLSSHPRGNKKEFLLSEFRNLLKKFEANLWNSTLTAAEYLRQVLIDQSLFEADIKLERSLLLMYPAFPKLQIVKYVALIVDKGKSLRGVKGHMLMSVLIPILFK